MKTLLRIAFSLIAAQQLSYASSIGVVASTGNTSPNQNCQTSTSCSTGASGYLGAPYISSEYASASANYGAFHAYSAASFVFSADNYGANHIGDYAFTRITTTETFTPSVLSGTLEYDFLLDGNMSASLPNCGPDCSVTESLTVSWYEGGGPFATTDTIFNLAGNLGAIAEPATALIPFSTTSPTGLTVIVEFDTSVNIAGVPVGPNSTQPFTGTADFSNTLGVEGVGIVGQPNASLNPASGFQYAPLSSAPEPSTTLLGAFGILAAFAVRRQLFGVNVSRRKL